MADFFSNLAGQVLGAAPEVGPLLPPRFAPWPGVPPAGVAPRPQELADAPARADAALFPPPLIDPAGPAVDAPLPSLWQMSALEPASGSPVQPDQPPLARDTLETAAFEPGGVRRDAATPSAPPSRPTPSMAPDEPPTPPVLRAQAGGDTDAALTASPAPPGASGDRLSQESPTTERDQALPPPPDSAPRPAAGQERSAPSAGLPAPPANKAGLLRYSQAEPVEAEPVEAEPIEAEPIEARPKPVKWQPEPVDGHAVRRFALDWPEGRGAKPVEARPEPVEGRSKSVEAHIESIKGQPEPVEGHAEPVEARPVRRFALDGPESRDTKPIEAGPVAAQPELVEARPEPTKGHAEPVEAHAAPASAPLTVQPAAPVVQRQATPAGQPVAPLVPPPVPAAAPDRPVSPQASATPTTAAPALITGSLEHAPPAARDVPGSREPTILPVPEPARPTAAEPEPAPTVRVTIGRVVVRAAPADERPPARRVELPRPTLSLEEYLQGGQGAAALPSKLEGGER
jgi:hypothetical protein